MFASKSLPAVLLVSLFILSLWTPPIWAQANSSVVGFIKDQSGAVIPGVEISIERVSTRTVRRAFSSDHGSYRVTQLVPGSYSVMASHPGFKTLLTRVEIATGQALHLDLVLELGEVAERVEVSSGATLVNVEQGRVSGLVDAQDIADLPLNGRNVYELMRLTAGAVDSRATIAEPGEGTNVNGGRKNMNGFLIDGVTNKGLSGGAGGGDYFPNSNPPPQLNLDAIREFRIETLNFSAEYGNSVASVVNLVTRSGGSQFHGSLHEFHRNRALDARQFLDEEKPQFTQNQFGFNLGGPLIKDNTFFFASYEGTRVRRSRTRISIFESPQWAAYVAENGAPVARFLFSHYPGPALDTNVSSVGEFLSENGYLCWGEEGPIPGCRPTQARVDALLGDPDLFGSPPGAISAEAPMLGESAFLLSRPLDADGVSIRVDQNLGTANQVYGHYLLTDWQTVAPQPRPGLDSSWSGTSQQLALDWIHVFSPAFVNEVRAGYTRNGGGTRASVPGLPYVADFPEILTFDPGINFDGRENVFTGADTVSLVRGDHSLKIGVEARRNQENSEFDVGIASYLFFDLVSMGLDSPAFQAAGVEPRLDQGPDAEQLASNFRGWRSSEVGIFLNDDWKIRPNLTLNLGLRWDWYGRLTEAQGRATAFKMSSGNDLWERVARGEFVGGVDKLSADDWNNLAPRLGVAWDPFKDGKMSLRAGFGIAYQSAIFNALSNSRWNKPFYSFNLAFPLEDGTSILYGPQDGSPVRVEGPNPNPGASLREGNIMAWDPDNPNLALFTGIPNPGMRDPYVMSFFVGIQRELTPNTTWEVNYVGTQGRKLLRAEDFNRFSGDLIGWASPTGKFGEPGCDFMGSTSSWEDDCTLNRVNPNEGVLRFWENSASSNYHSLQVSLDRRYTKGLALHASYTLSKSLDVRSTWHDGATTHNGLHEGFSVEVANSRLDYGRSIFDARHRLTFHWLWQPSLFENAGSWFLRQVAGGWQINGILALQSGQPFTPWTGLPFAAGGDFNADGTLNDRPNTPPVGNSIAGGRKDFVNPKAGIFNISGTSYQDRLAYFGRPEPGSVGTLGRNTFEGPGYANLDFSLFKEIDLHQIGEQGQLQFRAEFFNLLNRVNLFQPKTNLADPRFGRSTNAFDAREIQFGVRLVF